MEIKKQKFAQTVILSVFDKDKKFVSKEIDTFKGEHANFDANDRMVRWYQYAIGQGAKKDEIVVDQENIMGKFYNYYSVEWQRQDGCYVKVRHIYWEIDEDDMDRIAKLFEFKPTLDAEY